MDEDSFNIVFLFNRFSPWRRADAKTTMWDNPETPGATAMDRFGRDSEHILPAKEASGPVRSGIGAAGQDRAGGRLSSTNCNVTWLAVLRRKRNVSRLWLIFKPQTKPRKRLEWLAGPGTG